MTSESRERPKSITVVVPCYNERDNISALYGRLVPVLRSVSDRYEIIMINDGSTDGTLEEILGLISKDNNVKYISFSRNFGHEAAITAFEEMDRLETTHWWFLGKRAIGL